MFWFVLIGVILLCAVWMFWSSWRAHSHWTRNGVKQSNPTILLGDNWGVFSHTEPLTQFMKSLYDQYPDERYSGVYQGPIPYLVVRDPNLIRQITVKDFDHFTDHTVFVPEGIDPLWSKNLVSLKGDAWKNMRATLSPAFTSSKMKAMFYMMSKCAKSFASYYLEQDSDLITVEFKDNFTRYTNDIIATCAFGIEVDSMRQRDNEFYAMGKMTTNLSGVWNMIKFTIMGIWPALAKKLGLKFFNKDTGSFFTNLIKDTVQQREEKGIVRPDMIHLLMEARKGQLQFEEQSHDTQDTGFATVQESHVGISTKPVKQEITIEDMTAQALIFFLGGFDTTSVLMCFLGYELAVDQDVQKRLREEIDEVYSKCNGELTYEAINEMKYLDMVMAETLRKWPPGIVSDRVCTKPYTIPPENSSEVPLNLKVGDNVWIVTYGIHHDPKHYENPERFDPERFSDENKSSIKPYTYFPFGVGPRNCIASRFALLETKALFFHILSKFEIVPVEKSEIPIKLDTTSFNMQAQNGFWFGFKRRNL